MAAAETLDTLKARLKQLKQTNQRLKKELSGLKKENREIQKALRERNGLFSQIPVGVLLVQDGKIVFANPECWERTGFAEEELRGRDFLELIHPDGLEEVRKIHGRRLAGKPVPNDYETFVRTKWGAKLCCEIRVRRIRYRGRRAFLVGIMDMDRRAAEQRALIQSTKEQALTRVLTALSRDLGNFLQKASDLLPAPRQDRKGQPEPSAAPPSLLREGEWMATTLKRLAGIPSKAETETFDLRKTVKEAIAVSKSAWEEGRSKTDAPVAIKTYLRAIPAIDGNPEEIREAIAHVILNGLESLPPEGQMYLSTEESDGFVNVYIQDNGASVPPEIQEQIFEPYYTTKGGGKRGLGLSLARSIVTRYGGAVEFMGQVKRGSTVTLRFPVARKGGRSPKKGKKGRLKGSHVLILAGDGIVRDLLLQVFADKGIKASTAATDSEGLALLKKRRFDLVLVDTESLALEPVSLVSKVKERDPQLPVALLNAAEEEGRCGADLVMGKPLDMDRVLPFISQTVTPRGAPP